MTGVPYRIGKEIFVGIVLIDKKFVGKIKPQLAERVLRARRLRNNKSCYRRCE